MLIDKTESEQKFHARMLADVQDILLYFGVTPILSNSALLGAVRSGDLLSWQTGVVLIVKYEEVKEIQLDIINELNAKGFIIKKLFAKRQDWKITAGKNNFIVEIVGYHHNNENSRYERKVHGHIKSVPDYFFNPPYEKIKLRDVEYNIPLNYTGYLKLLYGENWETPIRSRLAKKFRNQELYR